MSFFIHIHKHRASEVKGDYYMIYNAYFIKSYCINVHIRNVHCTKFYIIQSKSHSSYVFNNTCDSYSIASTMQIHFENRKSKKEIEFESSLKFFLIII